MRRMDRNERKWPRASRKERVFIGAVLAVGSLALAAVAHARPEPIQPPVEAPEPDEAPGTGQDAPVDPEDPPPIPPPEGLDCIDGADQSDCDPGHPGADDGRRPGNTPPPAWYRDMARQMYDLQEELNDMAAWSAGQDPYIYYYSRWMISVVQQYYALGFHPDGSPRQYAYGPMTRGDFNYYHYYWVRPIYFSLLHYSAQYYERHRGSPHIPRYRQTLHAVSSRYHSLVLCNYGFNGDDMGSREDLAAQRAEARAGLGN